VSVAVEAGFVTKETVPLILGKAEAEAAALTAEAKKKGFTE